MDRSAGIEGEVWCLGVWMFSTLMCVLNGAVSVYYGDTLSRYIPEDQNRRAIVHWLKNSSDIFAQ